MTRLRMLKALEVGSISHILLQEERKKAAQRAAHRRVLEWEGSWLLNIDEDRPTEFLDLAVDALTRAAVVIKNAFDSFAVSMARAADVLGLFAEAVSVIEQAETRQRVLDWEGVWLWR